DLEDRGDAANVALLLCEEGRAWDAAGDLDRAEACWRQAERVGLALHADPIRNDVLIQLGRLDHLRGDLQSALDRYDAALAGSPPKPQALEVQLRRLLVLLDLNQWGQARTGYGRALDGASPSELPEEVRGLAGMVGSLLDGAASFFDGPEAAAHQAARR